jgi:hypothetical protein
MTGVNPDEASVDIGAQDILPRCCVICGQFTSWSKKVHRSRTAETIERTRSRRGSNFVFNTVGVICGLITGLFFWRTRTIVETTTVTKSLTIRVPICWSCWWSEGIPVRYIDLERGQATLVVHRRFKEQFLALRSEAKAAPDESPQGRWWNVGTV